MAVSYLDLGEYIGLSGYYPMGSAWAAVIVVDARQRWDKIDLLIKPKEGRGEVWVEATKVRLEGNN